MRAVSKMSGIDNSNQILQNRLNLGLVRSIVYIDIINMLATVVIGKNSLNSFFDFGFFDKFMHKSNLLKENYGVHFDKLSELV